MVGIREASWRCRILARERRRREGEEAGSVFEDSVWEAGPRGMMVLFLKQVHLQNVGAATRFRGLAVVSNTLRMAIGMRRLGLHVAEARVIRAPKKRSRSHGRAMARLGTLLNAGGLERFTSRMELQVGPGDSGAFRWALASNVAILLVS